jgi:hypothetical protein
MSDSFMSRRGKERASGTKVTMLQTYSKDAGFQLTLNRTDYKDGSHDMSCSIEMCNGNSVKNESGKGYKTMCNWKDDKIVISLSTDELALFSKYSDSYFLRRLGTPKPVYDIKTGKPVEEQGRPVYETDKQGNMVVYGENIYHQFDGKSSILKVFKNKMNPMGIGISLSKDNKTVTMYMDENVARKFALCCAIAMERMVMDDTYTFKYGASSGGNSNQGYSRNNYSSNPEQNPQPTSYRASRPAPDDIPDLPPVMDIDSMNSEDDIPF